jgi:N-acetylglucosaminyl-diphospho-decaprenol L-rhamnosyltransferase
VPLSVDIVVPVHDGWELSERCLAHLERQTLAHAVYLVDDGSSDGTAARVRSSFPRVHVVELGANRGFSFACNRGVEAGSGDVVVLLNNDVECDPRFVEAIAAAFASDERLGSAASLLLRRDGLIDSVGLTTDRTLTCFPRLRGRPREEAAFARPVLVGPAGAAGAYRRLAWEQAGGLDEGVFAYGEDLDLALRLRGAGFATTAVPEAVGLHLGSATFGRASPRQRYQAGFARAYFLRRYGILRTRAAAATLLAESLVVAADLLFFSRDAAMLRGRLHGWRAAAGAGSAPVLDGIDREISVLQSLRLRAAERRGA